MQVFFHERRIVELTTIAKSFCLAGGGHVLNRAKTRKKKTASIPVASFDYELFAEYQNIYFTSVDEKGTIHYVNDCLCKALGYTKQEVIGAHAYQFIREYNSHGAYQWNRIEEVVSNPAAPPIHTLELRCKNGSSLWVEMRERFFVMPGANLLYSVGIGLDVSAQHLHEQTLDKIHSLQCLSAFFNNAITKNFSFEEFASYAESQNLSLSVPFFCLFQKPQSDFNCKDAEHSDHAGWKSWSLPALHAACITHQAIVWDSREGIAALVSLKPDQNGAHQIQALLSRISDENKKHPQDRDTITGISDIRTIPASIASTYAQARESANLGPVLYPGELVYFWHKLGFIKLLLEINSIQSEQFIEERLGPLLHLPTSNQTELLHTLCEILTISSVSLVANRLHVHPKTIAYRKERLEVLLQANFDDPMERANLLVALRLYQIRNKNNAL